MTPDDPALVERARRGDRDALTTLWHSHRRWVAAVLLAHKPPEAELEDLLQDVATALTRNIGDLRDPTRFRPWLAQLARNHAVSAGRRAVRGRGLHVPHDPDGVTDPSAAPDELVGLRQEHHLTLTALEALSPEQRECLLLRAVHGLPQAVIAEQLAVPETTVETRLARARRTLRSLLGPQLAGPATPLPLHPRGR